ncbi:MAG: peptide deformylase [Bacteroidales bacterium]|jgi:peptide deformylase|nr:peptide deformylase [Bacteroidales bacterium]
MIYPIIAYGHPGLRKKAEDISPDYPDLKKFIDDLWETMYVTDGIGLAAPQINKSIRIFVIDATALSEKYPEVKDFKKTFINAQIIKEEGEEWSYSEGCLSIPDINETVLRKPRLLMRWHDEDFTEHEQWFDGVIARVIQHEYDHLEGILFTDLLSNIRKILLKGKLADISKGDIKVDYRMIFPLRKKSNR